MGEDAGFGLLEVVVASGIMLASLTSVAYVATNSFYDIAAAKERQTAIALVDETLEQFRALPYDVIARGVRTADLAGDPRILGAGTVASPYRLATTGERIKHASANQPVSPIVPNVRPRTVNGTVYSARFYLSHFEDNLTSGAFTATAYVDWTTNMRGSRSVSVRGTTVLFAPNATEVSTVGAGSGPPPPCQGPCKPPPAHSAGGTAVTGAFTINGSGTAGASIVNARQVLPVATSSMNVNGIPSVLGTATGGGVAVGATTSGFPAVTSVVDDNPATPAIDQSVDIDAPSIGASGYAAASGLGTISLSTTTGDTAESVATVAATAPDDCRDPANVVQTDGLPCGRTTAAQVGTARVSYNLAGIGLGAIPISETAASSVVAYTKHLTSAADGPCEDTSGPGCVLTTTTRSLGRIRIGGIPSVIPLPGLFAGYLVQLDGYTDSATAAAGIDAAAPTATVNGGVFSYWNGLGYTSIDLATSGTFDITTPALTVSSGLYSISVTTSVSRNASLVSAQTGTCDGLPCVTHAHAVMGSPMVGTVNYTFRLLGVQVFQLSMSYDIGDLVATASYTP